jgi:hypothetical protein
LQQMQPLLHLKPRRRTHRIRVDATVRALLMAWALHADPTVRLRTLLHATAPTATVVSRWRLSGLGLDTVRQHVRGAWSEARRQACRPRLRRFLCSRPRRRGHQEGAGRAWLAQRASPRFGSQPQVA